ncbi:hypothetical protein C8Q80DRAFT_369079 [Daedaleopsis nitida]|nr:hypothetical protein C8Q80DRAFT_369079 [Daedaleopsis nitida]
MLRTACALHTYTAYRYTPRQPLSHTTSLHTPQAYLVETNTMADATIKGMRQAGRGGNRLIAGGVATVAAGLGLFWYTQKANQTRKENSANPGAVPTWEYRLNQEQDQPSNPQQQYVQRTASADFPGTKPESIPTRSPSDGKSSTDKFSSTKDQSEGKQGQDAQPAPQREKEAGKGEIASKKQGGLNSIRSVMGRESGELGFRNGAARSMYDLKRY